MITNDFKAITTTAGPSIKVVAHYESLTVDGEAPRPGGARPRNNAMHVLEMSFGTPGAALEALTPGAF